MTNILCLNCEIPTIIKDGILACPNCVNIGLLSTKSDSYFDIYNISFKDYNGKNIILSGWENQNYTKINYIIKTDFIKLYVVDDFHINVRKLCDKLLNMKAFI